MSDKTASMDTTWDGLAERVSCVINPVREEHMPFLCSLIVAIAVGVICFVVLGRAGLPEDFTSKLAAGLGVCVLPIFHAWAKGRFSKSSERASAPLFSEWQRGPLQTWAYAAAYLFFFHQLGEVVITFLILGFGRITAASPESQSWIVLYHYCPV